MRGTAILAGVVLLSGAITASSDDYPRTKSGKPDFSGRYDISMVTPFSRPARFGDRAFLTAEEVEGMAEWAAARDAGDAASDAERTAPEIGGDVGAYNNVWFEWGGVGPAIDGKYRTSILTEPANGRMPEVTEQGRERFENAPRFAWQNEGRAWWLETGDRPYDGPETMILGVRCIYQGIATVPIRPLPYNNIKAIVQTDDHVMLHIEWMHWTRVIRMDAEHLPTDMRSLSGDSIGWWEDDTLVVETTNFLWEGNVARDDYRVVERFSPIDGEGLLYQFRVEDGDYAEPYGGEFVWPRTEHPSFEYACHEGNYAMGNMLRGARRLEREWHAAAAEGEE